jgi:anion-transporting  ArsA/GET3 family ATPase
LITIDPAERVANGATGNGELRAMTVDANRTFDEFVDRAAPGPERAAELKANPIYRQLSRATPGSQELALVLRLFELDRCGRFDVVVLDTPPSRNASEFLDAPRRLGAFFDSRAVQTLSGPAGTGLRIVGRAASPLVGVMGRLTGVELLADAAAFFKLLGGMTDDFRARAAQVEVMLRAPSTGVVLVTSPERQLLDETIWLAHAVQSRGLSLTAVLVNGLHRRLRPPPRDSDIRAYLAGRLSDDLTDRVTARFQAYEALARRDASSISRLRRSLPGKPVLTSL